MSRNGKIAIVTGAGSGIGRASAIALLQDGWTVTLAGRRQEPLLETVDLAGADGERTLVVPTDVADEDAMRHLFDATNDKYSRLDFLFNNAGSGVPPAHWTQRARRTWRR